MGSEERVAEYTGANDDQATELLLELAGTNLMMLTNEMDKMAVVCRRDERIDIELSKISG